MAEDDGDDGADFGLKVKHEVQYANDEEDEIDEEDLDDALNAAEDAETLDPVSLKKAVLAFEKKINKNTEMRSKYPNDPSKFLESEVELDVELKRLNILATSPELYPVFVKLNALPSILGVLAHENIDISVDVVDLLFELTEPDNFVEAPESIVLVDSIVENGALELLVQNAARLDENVTEEANAIHKTLGIMENLTEAKPDMCDILIERTKLLHWLLHRIQNRTFNDIKLYTTEVLAIILQSSDKARKKMIPLQGIEALLQAVAVYRKTDPGSAEETEMLENLFDCICTMLLDDKSRSTFGSSQGIELMIIMLKSKTVGGNALKVLDFALQNNAENCERFVDKLGLSLLFGMFMGKLGEAKKKRHRENEKAASDEHSCSIIVSLFHYLGGEARARLDKKFTEADHEKIDRLYELHARYYDMVEVADKHIAKRGKSDTITEEEQYLDRLDAGLFTLQLIDQIVAFVSENDEMKSRFLMAMNQNSRPIEEVKTTLKEFTDSLGDDTASGDAQQKIKERRTRMESLCAAL